jgi:hypothetical protein
MADQLPISVRLKKIDSQLVFNSDLDKAKFNIFLKSLDDNETVTVTYEVTSSSGSYAQLSKIHKCIRELASFTGSTFEEMKVQIKERSGLCFNGTCKSFSECSKEELSLVIQSILEIGDIVGFNLH